MKTIKKYDREFNRDIVSHGFDEMQNNSMNEFII